MAVENALGFLRSGARSSPAVTLIAGPQAFLREYVLDAVRLGLAEKGFQYRPIQVGGDGYGTVIRELEGGDLFAPRRLVACRVLKALRSSAADDEEGDAPEGRSGSAGDEASFAAALERVPSSVAIVMLYERDTAPARIRRVVEKAGVIVNCMRPFDNQIGQYLDIFARNLGLKVGADAADLLIARHGGDLAVIANSLGKAAISCGEGGKVGIDDLGAGGPVRTPELFELAESIARGRTGETLALFDRAIQTGRDPIELLAVEIIPLLRRMLTAASLLERRHGAPDVARALGMPPTSQLVARAVDGARRFGSSRLLQAHRRACELDAGFKNGLLREREQAIAALLLDLGERPGASDR